MIHSPTTRRTFLSDIGMGFGSLSLGAMLARDGILRADEANALEVQAAKQLAPKAKSVIWLFMVGGMSQMESFDPKPELNKYAGKTIAESPYAATLDSPYLKKNLREVIAGLHKVHPKIFPLQVGYGKRGQSGLEISDWWPHVGQCASTTSPSSARCGRPTTTTVPSFSSTPAGIRWKGNCPTIGSWVHYGLGSLNDNLPQFVVLGTPIADCCGGAGAHGANYLGPEHDGVQLAVDPENPLPFAAPPPGVYREEQQDEFALLDRLNGLTAADYPDDPQLAARIKSYELAFRMQTAVPDVVNFAAETAATQQLYGLDQERHESVRLAMPGGPADGRARRAVRADLSRQQRRGGTWDAHSNLKTGHTKLCGQVDQPIAGLLRDLKQRGLLDETLVVFGTEFGRTPGARVPTAATIIRTASRSGWPAAASKGASCTAATDELGFHAVENRHYVTDLHATVLHQLGLDPRRLEVPGRKRLEIDFGTPMREIIA